MGIPWLQPESIAIWWLGIGGSVMGAAGLLEWLRPPGRLWHWLRHAIGITSGLVTLAALAWGTPAALWGASLALTLVWLIAWVALPVSASPLHARLVHCLQAPQLLGTVMLVASPVAALVLSRSVGNHSPPRARKNLPSHASRLGVIDWQGLPWDRAPGQAKTDAGRPIPLFTLRTDGRLVARAQKLDAEVYTEFGPTDGMIRTAPPDLGYDCHGWIFTGGRYQIRGADVEQILKDNGYRAVHDPSVGDLAVYRNSAGTIVHSGIVVGFTSKNVPLVESKWGYIGRYVSPVHTRMYGMPCTFYRSSRSGHCLRGVGTESRNGGAG
jgi:hypothetical protein